MIKPTVGRKVWYRPSRDDVEGAGGQTRMMNTAGQPLDATVVAVWGDRCVNLAIFDIHAQLHERRSVTLVQEGDPIPKFGRYAEWMPYQVGQAKKEESAAVKPAVSSIPQHQLRVIDEKFDLDGRASKLKAFFDTETFRTLDMPEQIRLRAQHVAMLEYSSILTERIVAFPK